MYTQCEHEGDDCRIGPMVYDEQGSKRNTYVCHTCEAWCYSDNKHEWYTTALPREVGWEKKNMQKQQFPKILLEVTLTPNDRAAIMGGRTDNKHTKNVGDPVKIRLVQKTEKEGWPIVVIEEADGEDSMGAPRWCESTLPTPMVIALLVRNHGALIEVEFNTAAETIANSILNMQEEICTIERHHDNYESVRVNVDHTTLVQAITRGLKDAAT